jgi:predicted DNA-binding protein
MTLTVRLEPQLEDQLEDYCQQEGTTKSAVVTEALRQYLNSLRQSRSPYEIYQEVAAEHGLEEAACAEPGDNSLHYKQRLKEILRVKHER